MSQTLFIDGEWISAEKEQIRSIINPFNQEEIATVSEGGREDAIKAIAAARRAFDKGEWSSLSGLERGKIVLKIAELIRRDLEELAELESLDTGKTLEESKVIWTISPMFFNITPAWQTKMAERSFHLRFLIQKAKLLGSQSGFVTRSLHGIIRSFKRAGKSPLHW